MISIAYKRLKSNLYRSALADSRVTKYMKRYGKCKVNICVAINYGCMLPEWKVNNLDL